MSFEDDSDNGEWWIEVYERQDIERFVEELQQEAEQLETPEDVYDHVAFANFVLENTSDILYSVDEGSLTASKSSRLMRKLKNWIANLRTKVHSIANSYGAESYSLTVGAPFTVSISITFDTSAGIQAP